VNEIDLEDDALLLVEQNFYFLQTGSFFTALAKEYPLVTANNMHISKNFGEHEYQFNTIIIQEMLEDMHTSSKDKVVLFEYFVEMNAFRGICMAMVEALRLHSGFKIFIEEKLKIQYEDFFDLLSLVRNVLSHNIHADIYLDKKDYEGTHQRRLRQHRGSKIQFNFKYATHLPQMKAPSAEYGFSSTIDLNSLKEDTAFLDVLSLWELMMIAELCFNLVISYKLSSES